MDRFGADHTHVAAAVAAEDRAAVMDSLILCSFLRGVFEEPFVEWAQLLAPVTGWDIDAAELHSVAARIINTKRAYNAREGATAAQDTLPARILDSSVQLASGESVTLSVDTLHSLVLGYYAARGWDTDGNPGAVDLLEQSAK